MAVPYDLTTRWPTRNSHTTSVDSTADPPCGGYVTHQAHGVCPHAPSLQAAPVRCSRHGRASAFNAADPGERSRPPRGRDGR